MILRQFLHTDPVVSASYLFGCGGKASGAVVDPVEEPEFYLRAAANAGMRIQYVIDTHGHADHVSTGRTLAEAAGGAAYVLHADAGAAYPFHGVRDGDRLTLGNFSGSVCGRGLSGKPTSTIGFERRFNRAFAITGRDAFVAHMLREIPPAPPGAVATRAFNLGLAESPVATGR